MPNFDAILENLNSACVLLAAWAATSDPVGMLYGMLAGTYGGAAFAAAGKDHHTLGRCYVISAVLHGLISVCHHLHI